MKNAFQNSVIAHPVNDNKVFVRENFSPALKYGQTLVRWLDIVKLLCKYASVPVASTKTEFLKWGLQLPY